MSTTFGASVVKLTHDPGLVGNTTTPKMATMQRAVLLLHTQHMLDEVYITNYLYIIVETVKN